MPTMRLDMSYHGAPFSGFARQPGQTTVQGELEYALRVLLRREVETTCAGRTDAGVHARGQVVSFDVDTDELAEMLERGLPRFQRSLNAITPEAISVRCLAQTAPGFSARFDAKSREYRYFISQGEVAPVFMRDFSWQIPDALDVESMQAAAACLIGEHDFKSFCLKASAVGKPTCRNVMELSFHEESVMGEDLLCMKVIGSSFLHSMVRTLAGTLVAVGRGKRPVEWVQQVLDACDREAAGESAPARGLVFWRVNYEDDEKLADVSSSGA